MTATDFKPCGIDLFALIVVGIMSKCRAVVWILDTRNSKDLINTCL